jgi:hypothetical protein
MKIPMDIDSSLKNASTGQVSQALRRVLFDAITPAFGSTSKRELELSILEAFIGIAAIRDNPSVYDLVSGLRVTKSKARSLLYDRELRRQTPESLDALACGALRSPLLQAQGYAVALDIENPYLADHIRARVRELGHATDGSFSPNLIRLSSGAAAALIDHYLGPEDRKRVERALRSVTGEKGTAQTLMTKAISAAACAVAGKAGAELAEWGAKSIGSLIEASEDNIKDVFGNLFSGKDRAPKK